MRDVTKEEAEKVETIEVLVRRYYPVHYFILDIVIPEWSWASFVLP